MLILVIFKRVFFIEIKKKYKLNEIIMYVIKIWLKFIYFIVNVIFVYVGKCDVIWEIIGLDFE